MASQAETPNEKQSAAASIPQTPPVQSAQDSTTKPPTTRILTYFHLLVYASPTWHDYFLLVVGTISAIAAGVPFPLMGILFGELVDDMNDTTCEAPNLIVHLRRLKHLRESINGKVLQLVYLSIASLVLIYIYVLCFSLLSQRLAQRLREKYFSSLLRQSPSFFDARPAGEVSSRLNSDIQTVQSGTSEKLGIYIASLSFFVTAYVVAFIKDAQLAGMLISLVPAFLLMALLGGYLVQKFSGRVSDGIASASAVASEALGHVAVVQAFGAGKRLETKFAHGMLIAQKAGIKKALSAAIQAGLLYFIAFSANALAFWQGSRKIADTVAGNGDGTTVGEIYTVVFILVDACVVLTQVAPLLALFSSASAAFERLMSDIDREPEIDSSSEKGSRFATPIAGSLEFRDVSFSYPTRPDHPVLRNISISMPAGKYTAIVGPSGSGKSTIASLVTRLYDPTDGSVLLDNQKLQDLNIRHLRGLVGVVQQDPTLLNRSVLENIALGLVNSPNPEHEALRSHLLGSDLEQLAEKIRDGSESVEDIQSGSYGPEIAKIVALVREAAEIADAYDFVKGLRHGFGTEVGTSGSLLSGGQKQRIALARALIRDPRVLVLDEATSSLDSATEWRIQNKLKDVSHGRTVVSIAHRLSTIRDADNIIVMKAGEVVEQGTHFELFAFNGVYSDMVKLQELQDEKNDGSGSTRDMSIDLASPESASLLEKKPEMAATQPGSDETSDSAEACQDTALGRKLPMGAVVKRIGRFTRPHLALIFLGIFSAIIVGGTYSASGIIFGNTVGKISTCNSPSSIRSLGQLLSGMFFLLAVVEFFANFFSWGSFGFIAEKLLYKLRVLSFRSLFEQGMAFHESEDRSPSALLSIITKDTAELGGFSGSVMGTLISVSVNLLVAIILSHVLAWKIAIVCLVCVPILLGSGLMQLREISRFQQRHAEAFAKAVGITVEAVNSIKTIAALSLEQEVFLTYRRSLRKPSREMVGASAYANVWLAIAYSTGNLIYAFAYWWGAKLILKGEYTPKDFFIILVAMLVGAQLWGQMFALAPEISRARLAASRILNLIGLQTSKDTTVVEAGSKSRRDDDDPESAIDATVQPLAGTGGVSVAFRDVSFSYPSRPDVVVLQGISFEIRPGQFCGLVGSSGAGKSTIMGLVQGMYTCSSGAVELDGLDLSRLDGPNFKNEISVVPQNSALFDGTVKFNVGLGARTSRETTMAEIEEACRTANIHDDILALPQGYDTECGPNGSQLSGGQRQRLAIARALVRKPRLLLLDESTSALDAENEKALQEGLERAARGITVIAITHRIHTVRRADVILVVDGGKIVDRGTHEELLERSDSYRANASHQRLGGGL